MNRLRKLAAITARPSYWRALAHRVAPTVEHAGLFVGYHFDTVIDVGANKGQFAYFASRLWPRARIFAFEPQERERQRLQRLLGSRVTCFACALGEHAGKAEFHVATRADSSSLLSLGELQKSAFAMDEAGTITVDVRRLDEAIDASRLTGEVLLKIDVQGFEYEVLKGAAGLMDRVSAVFVEVSFVELYQGQRLWRDIEQLLTDGGFGCKKLSKPLTNASGQDIQADAIFVRQIG